MTVRRTSEDRCACPVGARGTTTSCASGTGARIKALHFRNRRDSGIPIPPTGGTDFKRARALYEEHRRRYGKALQAFHRRLRRILAGHGFNPAIKHRVKSFDSYVRKLQRLRETSVEGMPTVVRDILGLRVSAAFLEDVEHICDVITKRLPVTEIERKGDGRASNAFGYESVHLIVRLPPDSLPSILPDTQRVCEIQLRTILQDAWAEVEHELVYGAGLTFPPDSITRKLASLNAMLGLSDAIFQEIRDGQKQLREHAESRREILENTAGEPRIRMVAHPFNREDE